MKYIRTKDGIYKNEGILQSNSIYDEPSILVCGGHKGVNVKNIVKQADTIEELVQIGDIVFYWQQSDDKEHCSLMVYDTDIRTMKYNAITKLLIPVGEDYKCVAKGFPSFNVIKGRRYLVSKGELELL